MNYKIKLIFKQLKQHKENLKQFETKAFKKFFHLFYATTPPFDTPKRIKLNLLKQLKNHL